MCDPIDSGHTTLKDISNFYENLAGNFAEVVQYNKDNREQSHYSIDDICDVLEDDKNGIAIDRLAKVSNMLLQANKEDCLDYNYEKMIKEMRNISWSSEVEGGEVVFFSFKNESEIP